MSQLPPRNAQTAQEHRNIIEIYDRVEKHIRSNREIEQRDQTRRRSVWKASWTVERCQKRVWSRESFARNGVLYTKFSSPYLGALSIGRSGRAIARKDEGQSESRSGDPCIPFMRNE